MGCNFADLLLNTFISYWSFIQSTAFLAWNIKWILSCSKRLVASKWCHFVFYMAALASMKYHIISMAIWMFLWFGLIQCAELWLICWCTDFMIVYDSCFHRNSVKWHSLFSFQWMKCWQARQIWQRNWKSITDQQLTMFFSQAVLYSYGPIQLGHHNPNTHTPQGSDWYTTLATILVKPAFEEYLIF